MNMQFWLVLLIAGLSQTLFLLLIFLLRPGPNRRAGRLLTALLAIISCIFAGNIWVASGLYNTWPALPGYFRGMIFLLGPLCYLYGCSLLHPAFRFRISHLLHTLPYLAAFTIARVQESAAGATGTMQGIERLLAGKAQVFGWHYAWYIAYHLHVLLYFFMLRQLLRQSLRGKPENYLIPLTERVRWIKRLGAGFLMLVLVFTAVLVYVSITGYYTIGGNFIYTLALAVWTYIMAWQSFAENRLLFPAFAGKYQSTKLNDSAKERLLQRLRILFEEERIFTSAGLTLAAVAQRLQVPAHLLSQAINDRLGMSFNDLLHEYRIAAFKQLARQPAYARYTIMAIAADAGFASRASFNAAFRKSCGITPSEWMKQAE
jgi:AraC-like DNA-binding protein